jgi:cell division protein ZapA
VAIVNLTINGRVHEISCDESQVARVTELGHEVDSRAQALLKQIGNVPDVRLLVMVGLMLADEVSELREQLRAASGDVDAAAHGDAELAEGIEALAERIEGIADRLERA